MATPSETHDRVRQLHAEATAKAEETVAFLASLTPSEAAAKTEIGWTVAATAAHLAAGPAFTMRTIAGIARGKPPHYPAWVVHTYNFVMSRASARQPIATSVARLRTTVPSVLTQLDTLTDADLDHLVSMPFAGTATAAARLRYELVSHLDEHMGQIRRALQ